MSKFMYQLFFIADLWIAYGCYNTNDISYLRAVAILGAICVAITNFTKMLDEK